MYTRRYNVITKCNYASYFTKLNLEENKIKLYCTEFKRNNDDGILN